VATYTEMVYSSIRDILDVVFRHKGKSTLFFSVVVSSVTLFTYLAPPVYRAEAQLLVRSGRENLSVDLSSQERAVTMLHDRETQENRINSEVTILSSRYLLEQVVAELGEDAFLGKASTTDGRSSLVSHYFGQAKKSVRRALTAVGFATHITPHEQAVKNLMKDLILDVPHNSNIINVSYELSDRHLAKNTLELLLRRYLERHLEINRNMASPSFFEVETEKVKQVLVEAEEALEDFRELYSIASLSSQQDVLLLLIKDLEYAEQNAAAQVEASRARSNSLRSTMEGRSKELELSRVTGVHNFGVDAMKENLLNLRVEEVDVSARYQDAYPPLIELREKIRKTEEVLADEEDTHTEITLGPNLNYQSLELDLDKERSRLASEDERFSVLSDKVAGLKDQLLALSSREVRLKNLERDVQLADEDYRQYRGNLHRARISKALDENEVSNVSVIQPAELPLAPVRPKKALTIFMGFIVGLLGGFGVAYVFTYFDDTFKNNADVEKLLELPVLASISEGEFRSCT
jgi:uncharacterized protein involved in exopolysaccharide biosynthesis